jgi:hypothetical protein
MRIAFVLALVPAFLSAPVLHADDGKLSPTAVGRMKKDLFFLAGEECEGRGMETKGILKAGDYVAASFAASGLTPAGTNGYFQPFTISGGTRLGSPNTLTMTDAGGERFEVKYDSQFKPTGFSGSGKTDAAPVVFAGYGISADKLDGKVKSYDDYAGLDVKGKVVVVLRRTPRSDDKANPFEKAEAQHAALATKVALAQKAGAAGVIFVNDATYARDSDALMDFRYAGGQAAKIPVVHAKRALLEKMLAGQGESLEKIEAKIDETLKPHSVAIQGWKASLVTTVTKSEIAARNVVGVLEGSGPLANETVVVGAHYDHLGYGEPGSLLGVAGKGKLHYGADDNASGTTGLMEIARHFGRQKDRVGRRIVFIAFAGEERGLFGSIHYCKEPTFPLADTVFMLNLDMIGRVVPVPDVPATASAEAKEAAAKKDRIVVYGTGTTPGMEEFVDKVNAEPAFGFKLLKIPGGTGPSDHDSFYRKHIPVLFFFSGTHKDYHRPTDTPDKVNLAGMAKVVGFAEECLRHFATLPERPKYLVTKGGWEDPTEERANRPSRPTMPKLGIMPGNYEATEGGVLVEELTPGGAAERGGLKAKDVIVSIGGKEVKNIEGYMTAMAAQKAGSEVDVVVLRGEKKVTVKVKPTP